MKRKPVLALLAAGLFYNFLRYLNKLFYKYPSTKLKKKRKRLRSTQKVLNRRPNLELSQKNTFALVKQGCLVVIGSLNGYFQKRIKAWLVVPNTKSRSNLQTRQAIKRECIDDL